MHKFSGTLTPAWSLIEHSTSENTEKADEDQEKSSLMRESKILRSCNLLLQRRKELEYKKIEELTMKLNKNKKSKTQAELTTKEAQIRKNMQQTFQKGKMCPEQHSMIFPTATHGVAKGKASKEDVEMVHQVQKKLYSAYVNNFY